MIWPNCITGFRLVGSPGLVILAVMEQPIWLAAWAVVLVATEWLDGFLARRWHQESVTGARLDTVADATFYSSLLVAIVILRPSLIAGEIIWIAAAIGSYLLSWFASWIKFGRLPSYHTWAAKGVWLIVGSGILCLLAGWSVWLFRGAMICVVLTNLEAVAITLLLPKCQVDVPSVWHVAALRARSRSTP